jgi:cytochrome P450
MEGVLILASVANHWKLSLPKESPKELPIWPAIALRPKGGVRLRVDRRG